MTAAEFKKKWSRYQGKESAAYQEHFIDLWRLLGQPTPVEADPSGNDFFCFQKRVVKGAEFLNLEHPDCGDPTERGFADVWRKDCFGWEYKGKKKSLDIDRIAVDPATQKWWAVCMPCQRPLANRGPE